jgi:hypothetical protein
MVTLVTRGCRVIAAQMLPGTCQNRFAGNPTLLFLQVLTGL